MKTYSDVTPAEFDVQFVEGFGRLLANAGIGAWDNDYELLDYTVAIVAGDLPSSPSSALALASYAVSDDPELSDSVMALQVTARADGPDPRPTSRLAASVYDRLHGMTNVVLPGGVYVVQCLRQSAALMDWDSNQRRRSVQNFYATVHRPSQHRI